jgi:cAMP-dependent protein kinase regulator
VIEIGQVDIIRDDVRVARIGPGKSFGDLCLFCDVKCPETVRAQTVCIFWVIDRTLFRSTLYRESQRTRAQKIDFLRTVTMFANLNDITLGQISDVLVMETYPPGTRVIRQGEVHHTHLILSHKSFFFFVDRLVTSFILFREAM